MITILTIDINSKDVTIQKRWALNLPGKTASVRGPTDILRINTESRLSDKISKDIFSV